jgi:hypothetical protein
MADANSTFSGAPSFQAGRPVSAAALEQLRQADQRILPSRGLGVLLRRTAQGTLISVPRQRRARGTALGQLVLTQQLPPWWEPPKNETKSPKARVFVTWGAVNNRIPVDQAGPSNGGIFRPIEIMNEVTTHVWVKVTFNDDLTDVASAEIHAGGVSDLPQWNQEASDEGTKNFYILLGAVYFSGTSTPKSVVIVNQGSGSIGCALYQSYQGGCVLPDGATVPVTRNRLAPAFWRM